MVSRPVDPERVEEAPGLLVPPEARKKTMRMGVMGVCCGGSTVRSWGIG